VTDIPKIETDLDDLSKFENKETAHTVPLGWWLLFFGLIVWGAWYLWTYSPALGGWSQAKDAEGGGASMGSNLLATIAFTALPTAAAVGLWLAQRRRKQA
jgi:hypothetical protein